MTTARTMDGSVAYLRKGARVLLVRLDGGDISPVGSAYVCDNTQYLTAQATLFSPSDTLGFVMIWNEDGSVEERPSPSECVPVSISSYRGQDDVAVLKIDFREAGRYLGKSALRP